MEPQAYNNLTSNYHYYYFFIIIMIIIMCLPSYIMLCCIMPGIAPLARPWERSRASTSPMKPCSSSARGCGSMRRTCCKAERSRKAHRLSSLPPWQTRQGWQPSHHVPAAPCNSFATSSSSCSGRAASGNLGQPRCGPGFAVSLTLCRQTSRRNTAGRQSLAETLFTMSGEFGSSAPRLRRSLTLSQRRALQHWRKLLELRPCFFLTPGLFLSFPWSPRAARR